MSFQQLLKKIRTTKLVVQLCPKCMSNYFTPYGEEYHEHLSPPFPALSRRDNKTLICSQCGEREALEDFLAYERDKELDKGESI